MQNILRQISKQNQKIIRILTKTIEKWPNINGELQLALFAALQIEKNIGKQTASPTLTIDKTMSKTPPSLEEGKDDILNAAWNNIELFKQSTAQLESKINILINESQHHRHKPPHYYQKTEAPLQQQPKRLKPAKINKKADRSSRLQSRPLSEIDESILKLTCQLRRQLQLQQQGPPDSRTSSLVEHYNQS